MLKKPIAWTLVFTVFAGGCLHYDHGDVVAEHKPGDSPNTTRADYTAKYSIFEHRTDRTIDRTISSHWETDGGDGAKAYIHDFSLSRGEEIGFENGENGKLVAVAGNERIPLDDGHYCWEEAEPHGGKLLFNTASIIVGLPITIPVMVVTWPTLILAEATINLVHPAAPASADDGD